MPKYNLEQPILNLKGKPLKQDDSEDAKDVVLRDILSEAALFVDPKNAKELTGEVLRQTMDLYILAKDIQKKSEIELTIDQTKLLKDQVAIRYRIVPLIAMQVHQILENGSVEEEKKKEEEKK